MALTVRIIIEAAAIQPVRQIIAEAEEPAAKKNAKYEFNMRPQTYSDVLTFYRVIALGQVVSSFCSSLISFHEPLLIPSTSKKTLLATSKTRLLGTKSDSF